MRSGGGFGEVSFIVLEDEGQVLQGGGIFREIPHERASGFKVFLEAAGCAVGDEDEAISPAEDQLAGGVVVDLTGDGVEGELGSVTADLAGGYWHEVKIEGAVGGGGDRDQVTSLRGIEACVHVTEISRLAAHGSAGVDDFEGDLTGLVVDEGHGGPLMG